jgi:hypothetical protein
LNGDGGYTLTGAGRTVPTPNDTKRRRRKVTLNEPRARLEAQVHRHAHALNRAQRRLRALQMRAADGR